MRRLAALALSLTCLALAGCAASAPKPQAAGRPVDSSGATSTAAGDAMGLLIFPNAKPVQSKSVATVPTH